MATRQDALESHRVGAVQHLHHASAQTACKDASIGARKQKSRRRGLLLASVIAYGAGSLVAHSGVVAAPSATASLAQECWALGSGLLPFWWGMLPVWRVIDLAQVGETGETGETDCIGCLAGRSRAPALRPWANVRNVRRCNVRPPGVSNPDSRVSIPLPVSHRLFFSLFTGSRGSLSPVQAYTDLFSLSSIASFAPALGMNPAAALRL